MSGHGVPVILSDLFLVILSEAKNPAQPQEVLRFTQDDKDNHKKPWLPFLLMLKTRHDQTTENPSHHRRGTGGQ